MKYPTLAPLRLISSRLLQYAAIFCDGLWLIRGKISIGFARINLESLESTVACVACHTLIVGGGDCQSELVIVGRNGDRFIVAARARHTCAGLVLWFRRRHISQSSAEIDWVIMYRRVRGSRTGDVIKEWLDRDNKHIFVPLLPKRFVTPQHRTTCPFKGNLADQRKKVQFLP